MHDTKQPCPIASIESTNPRPLWSVMIPAYNCASFLAETLRSVLAQAPNANEMQIEVVDDCSTRDDPSEVVSQIGQGRVSFFRKAHNEGAIANFNTCITRSRGHLVHILHGDDFVLPGFYPTLQRIFEESANISAAFTRCLIIDESGNIDSMSERLSHLEQAGNELGPLLYGNSLCTPGVVVRRSFYETHGGFRTELVHTADWEMWARSIHCEGAQFVNQPLACYRIFPHSDTSRLRRTGENIRDQIRLASLFARAYPQFNEGNLLRILAENANTQAQQFKALGDNEAFIANRQLWHSLTPLVGRLVRHGKNIFKTLVQVR